MLANAVFGRDFLQVVEQFLALAEIAGPGVPRAEGVGIGMVRRVDPAAGIAVDVPGATKSGILLDDSVGDAELPKRHRKRNGADAGADDQDMLRRQGLIRWTTVPASFARDKSHLLA